MTTSLAVRRTEVRIPNHLKMSRLGMSHTKEPPAHFDRMEVAKEGSRIRGRDLNRHVCDVL